MSSTSVVGCVVRSILRPMRCAGGRARSGPRRGGRGQAWCGPCRVDPRRHTPMPLRRPPGSCRRGLVGRRLLMSRLNREQGSVEVYYLQRPKGMMGNGGVLDRHWKIASKSFTVVRHRGRRHRSDMVSWAQHTPDTPWLPATRAEAVDSRKRSKGADGWAMTPP